ncbi:MAG TPA: hydrogenase 4 subunit B [Blastocatellia bacterium]|nr:hydrogenase 4 subunit B [Blastocatellia bacterium]
MNVLLTISFSAYMAGVLGSLVLKGSWARSAAAFCGTAGAVAGAGTGALALAGAGLVDVQFAGGLPLGAIRVSVDGLSGLFLVVIGLVGAAASVYSFGYTDSYRGRYSERSVGAMSNLLLLSFTGVVIASNALTFLLGWELMVISTFLAVLTEHRQVGAVSASVWYIALSHVAFVAIVPMFLIVAGGDLIVSFSGAREFAAALSPRVRDMAFLLALVGFGIKAGLVPLHAWLPLAHPVAPSHVSALMSGVAIKIAIYGLVRVVFVVLGGGPAWWGVVVLAAGAASAVLGVLYALMEHDLKRLLAFHSVENIGIIVMALGASLLFVGYGRPDLAWLGLAAGLFHTVNHAAFKSLLFLAAGSVLHATHTRNIEELGGLARRMPWTSAFFLVGSAAISALPPLNGFASEWLVFESLLGGFEIHSLALAMVIPVAVGMLALTGGLAAACFVKAFGITFLAIPRSTEAERARESPVTMRAGMLLLASACLALGIGASAVVPVLGRIVASVPHMVVDLSSSQAFSVTAPATSASFSPPFLAVWLVATASFAAFAIVLVGGRLRMRRASTWGCGRFDQTSRMQYTATAFAEPLRRIFAEIYRPSEDLSVSFHPDSKYFVSSIVYRSAIRQRVDELLYDPVISRVRSISVRVRHLQAGSVHLYIAYVAGALVAAMLMAILWSGP